MLLKLDFMSEAERLKMGASGRAYAEREFNRDRLVSSFEAWVKELRETNLRATCTPG